MSQATRKPSTVGDIILYEYLEPSGLKINDLAEMLNVHRNSASALVNNNRKPKRHIGRQFPIIVNQSTCRISMHV